MFKHVVLAATLAAGVVAAPAAAVTNLITNGSFETGSFAGWTITANQGTAVQSSAGAAESGSFYARLRTTGATAKTLTQSVATTLGDSYKLTYFLKNNGTAIDSLTVATGGSASVFGDRSAFGYTQFTQVFTGLAGSTPISFAFSNAYTRANQGSFFLDTVTVSSITTVPEPQAWALLLVGFTMVGTASRRRRRTIAA